MTVQTCERCPTLRTPHVAIMVDATHAPCCSSHGKTLCCPCYRTTHYVEIGRCCARWVMRPEDLIEEATWIMWRADGEPTGIAKRERYRTMARELADRGLLRGTP